MGLMLLIPLCVLLTALISGVLGMAGGMILMGCLVTLLPVASALTLHAVAQFVSNGWRALLHRRHIVWKPLRFYVLGLAAAVATMSLIAFVPDPALVFILLGILPFAQLILAKHLQLNIAHPVHGFICGFVSTLLHLSGGIAGMLLDVFYQRTAMTRHQIIASKATTQTLSHMVRMVYFTVVASSVTMGAATALSIYLIAGVTIAAIAGTALSSRLLDRLSDKNFRRITQLVLLVLGMVFLARGVYLYAST